NHRVEAALGEVQRREFIQSREQQASETAGLEEGEYIFKHAITHDVAYDSMLFARRKELHQLAAEAIEALFPGRLDELSATLGITMTGRKRPSGRYFISGERRNEQRRRSPMR